MCIEHPGAVLCEVEKIAAWMRRCGIKSFPIKFGLSRVDLVVNL